MKSGYRGGNQRASAGGARRSNQRKGGNDAIHGHINRIPERTADPDCARKPETMPEEEWADKVVDRLPILKFGKGGKSKESAGTAPEGGASTGGSEKNLENLDDIAAVIGCRPRQMAV